MSENLGTPELGKRISESALLLRDLIQDAGSSLSDNDLFKFKHAELTKKIESVISLSLVGAGSINLLTDAAFDMSNLTRDFIEEMAKFSNFRNDFLEKIRTTTEHIIALCRSYRMVLSESRAGMLSGTEDGLILLRAESDQIKRDSVSLRKRLDALDAIADKALKRAESISAEHAIAARNVLDEEVQKITKDYEDTRIKLDERLNDFDIYRKQAKGLLSEMAAKALAGGHIESAKEEERFANDFRDKALSFMKVGGVVIGLILFIALFQDLSWTGVANRAMLVLLLVAPTAYLARESAKHRAQAIELRRASLDFAAVEPFLQGIQGEDGLRVRAELARRAFFAGSPVDASSSYGLDPQALLTKLMDTLSDVSKAKT